MFSHHLILFRETRKSTSHGKKTCQSLVTFRNKKTFLADSSFWQATYYKVYNQTLIAIFVLVSQSNLIKLLPSYWVSWMYQTSYNMIFHPKPIRNQIVVHFIMKDSNYKLKEKCKRITHYNDWHIMQHPFIILKAFMTPEKEDKKNHFVTWSFKMT